MCDKELCELLALWGFADTMPFFIVFVDPLRPRYTPTPSIA